MLISINCLIGRLNDLQEIWKNIEGYEGQYQISNLGRVKSLARINYANHFQDERILTPVDHGKGYLLVHLSRGTKVKQIAVHRLVAETFIPNPNNKPQVNHLDEDVTNNRLDNLEWCSSQENLTYGHRIENAWKTRTANKTRGRRIKKFTISGDLVEIYPTIIVASRENGVSGPALSAAERHNYTSAGHKWRYMENAF